MKLHLKTFWLLRVRNTRKLSFSLYIRLISYGRIYTRTNERSEGQGSIASTGCRRGGMKESWQALIRHEVDRLSDTWEGWREQKARKENEIGGVKKENEARVRKGNEIK